MHVSVTWEHGLTFIGQGERDFSVRLSADRALGGDADGLGPRELVLIALAGCTGMDVLSILRKKRQVVTAFEVHVRAQSAHEVPHVFTAVALDYIVRGQAVTPEAVERAIELSVTKYCPVHAMLAKAVPIEHRYEIVEDESGVRAPGAGRREEA